MGVAIIDRGHADEPQAGVLFGLGDRAPLVWPVPLREAQPPAGVALVGLPATTDMRGGNQVDPETAVTGEDAQSMQRLIAAILEKGGR